MAQEAIAFNHRYFVDRLVRETGRMLDYGCGGGAMVALGRARGLDIWGADKFDGFWEHLMETLPPEARDRVRAIEGQRADYPDATFDVVVSNQVLEHVDDPEAAIADVSRLLRPGGLFVAAFPVVETWYEGHVGLYFAHRFKPGGKARRAYFRLCHRLGFGLHHHYGDDVFWAEHHEKFLDESCFYYRLSRVRAALENSFGSPIQDECVDYMRARLGHRAARLPLFADPLLKFVYHIRAGQILAIRKAAR